MIFVEAKGRRFLACEAQFSVSLIELKNGFVMEERLVVDNRMAMREVGRQ